MIQLSETGSTACIGLRVEYIAPNYGIRSEKAFIPPEVLLFAPFVGPMEKGGGAFLHVDVCIIPTYARRIVQKVFAHSAPLSGSLSYRGVNSFHADTVVVMFLGAYKSSLLTKQLFHLDHL